MKTVGFRLLAEALGRCGTRCGRQMKKQNRKNVYLSPYVEEPLNSKVIKGFVPELRCRYVVFKFRDSYVLCYIYIYIYEHYMSILHIAVSGYGIDASLQWLKDCIKNSKGRLITALTSSSSCRAAARISLTLSRHFSLSFIDPVGLLDYIPYLHIAAVWMFELIVLLLPGHKWGSIGVHHL